MKNEQLPPDHILNPDKGRDISLEVLQAWNKRGPILFIGETCEGCTGSEPFYELLDKEYIEERIEGYQGQRSGIKDKVIIFTPK